MTPQAMGELVDEIEGLGDVFRHLIHPIAEPSAVRSGRDWGEIAPIIDALGPKFSTCLSHETEIVAVEACGDLAYIGALEHTTASITGGAPTSYPARDDRVASERASTPRAPDAAGDGEGLTHRSSSWPCPDDRHADRDAP